MSERLAVGDKAPAFTLPDDQGNKVKLSSFKGRRVIVYFYPAALTPGCTKQACDFTENLELFNDAGIDILAISPDKVEKLARFREKESLTIPLLSDVEKSTLEAYGAYGEKTLYGKKVIGVIRSTFIVGPTGKIEYAGYGVKATGHVAKLIKDLEL